MALREAGTWERWRDTVGKLSLRSNAAMLAICAAFAAPLLHFTARQSFGLNLFGRAKAGKTSALLAGASVIGLGREGDLPNWGATAAAKGESARMFNDMLFPLNEVGLLGGSKKKAYPEIRETIYRLGEGRERLRHTQSIFSAPAASSEVRTIFFSTAEHSFDDYAALAGRPETKASMRAVSMCQSIGPTGIRLSIVTRRASLTQSGGSGPRTA